jgi:hypothetical protein
MNQETTSSVGTVRTRDTFGEETETVIGDQAFYDRRWNTSYVTTEREYNRIFATIRAIPGDCQSILDVGTGAGLLATR